MWRSAQVMSLDFVYSQNKGPSPKRLYDPVGENESRRGEIEMKNLIVGFRKGKDEPPMTGCREDD